VEWNVQLIHGEAIVYFKRKMIQKHCLISFEQKPIFNFPNGILFGLSFLIFLSDWFIYILFFGLIGLSWVDDWYFFIFDLVG